MKDDKLANDISKERIDKEPFKKGFNFVGSNANWTSLEEQKIKVKEIENKTKKTKEK